MSNLTAEDLKLLGDLFDTKFEDKFKVVEEKIKSVHIQMDTQFKLVHERLANLDGRLEKVEIQTTKTNGRVSDLEKKTNNIELKEATHILSCPNIEKINKINEDLSEYRFFKKYPKIAVGIIIVTCISLFMGGYIAWSKFTKEIESQIKTEITSVSDTTH